jgi:hypothetical protein
MNFQYFNKDYMKISSQTEFKIRKIHLKVHVKYLHEACYQDQHEIPMIVLYYEESPTPVEN